MSERLLSLKPSERALEQAILALKKGTYILKYGRRGKPKLHPFSLSMDERTLIWLSGNEEKHLQLSSVMSIIRGHETRKLQPERASHSFSLIYIKDHAQCSLDLICKDKMQADTWFLGLKALISRCQDSKQLGKQKSSQSFMNSPTSFIRRKYNLGFLKETPKMAQVGSMFGSPVPSVSDKCFSDGLSFSSDSLRSRSSLSSIQNTTDCLVPHSPGTKHQEPEKSLKAITPFLAELPLNRKSTEPTDVWIWGEGVKNGTDTLLPKVLDSVSLLDVEEISLAGKHAVLTTKSGQVSCWGEGKSFRVGNMINGAKDIENLDGFHVKSVSCSEYQTCALTVSGELFTWGDSCSGQSNRWLPRRVSGGLDGIRLSMVACGEWHTAIVSTFGQLYTFGDGTFGVLGHGDCKSLTEPKLVESLKAMRVKSVACGTWHTAAVVAVGATKSSTPTGKLFTWGDGDKGRLGHGNPEITAKPTLVIVLIDHDFVQVSCGRMLTVGLTTTGMVYTIGSSVYGQLGNPQARDNSITLVQGKLKFEFVRKIASGSYHVAVLTSNGSVYTWGRGANGQLGVGDTEDRSSPTLVEALTGQQVQKITCGSSSTAAICLHKSMTFGVDQSACHECNVGFGFMKKKHTCYNCGNLFCSVCSGNKSKNACLAPDETKPVRVCDSCYKSLSGRMLKIEDVTPRPMLTKTFSEQTGVYERRVSGSDFELGSLMMNRAPRPVQVSTQKTCQPSLGSTVKHKGAKDVIKVLTSKLHLMSPRAFMRKQEKLQVVTTTISEQNKGKQEHEWMEQFQPGVYITFIMLPTGRKGIKRVRFSKKVFREREAERWWEDNQQRVYDKYDVDGYINSG